MLGIGSGDANPWDLGVGGGVDLLSPTNSIIQQNAGTYPYNASLQMLSLTCRACHH